MTNVNFKKVNGLITEIDIFDHANAAPYGQDLICNSISVASQLLGIGITEVLKIDPEEIVFDPSIPKIKFVLNNYQALKAVDITNTFYEYINLFSTEYKNYLKMGVTNEQN